MIRLSLLLSIFLLGAIILWALGPISFVSWESKTHGDGEVINRIKFIPGWRRDTWLMLQSHHGKDLPQDEWDRLAIVVDKSSDPKKALFYQFAPKGLEMGSKSEQVAFRAPCFSCHSNGPRAIRPKSSSWPEYVKSSLLNLRIKSYFAVTSEAGNQPSEEAAFKRAHPALDEPLALKSCSICHSDKGIRRPLTMHQLSSARFLIENHQMPPWPLAIDEDDKKTLKEWGL